MGGVVKWYNGEKGFGFINADDGGKDVFVHVSALQRSNLVGLDPDQKIRMKVIDGAKGREAVELSRA
ncbi:MAG: cold-shock protein [Alphaproteobacteria bacterium]|nr:cold-shock protein [Alphaproteobacteria bacterium]